MKAVKIPLFVVTLVLVVYTVLLSFNSTLNLALIIFGVSPILVFLMVYKVMKQGIPAKFFFKERFYEDENYGPLG